MPGPARAVLESGRLAHLVTVGPDGAPQVSCVRVGIEDDEIVFASLAPRRILDNIARDPRVALSIETDEVGRGLPLQHRDALDVGRLREEVDRADAAQRVARIGELGRVGRQRRRVA